MVTVEQRLAAQRDSMSPAELRVALFLVDRPETALLATAAEIARAADTSNATVVRAIQALGYAGLPEFRREVGEQIVTRYDPTRTLDERLAMVQHGEKSALDTVLQDGISLLTDTRLSVDRAAFQAAVAAISDSKRVVVAGWGTAGAAADYVALTLNRTGLRAVTASQSGFLLADNLADLASDDVLLLIAPLLHVQEISVTLSCAKRAGATSVLVTELLGEKLKDEATHVIVTGSSRRYSIGENLALMAVLEAILLGVTAIHPDRARRSWTAINEIRSNFSTGALS